MQISVDPARGQWWPGAPTLDLNPIGRAQNKKRRALLPVVPLLGEWLAAARARFDAMPAPDEDEHACIGKAWLVADRRDRGAKDVDRAWATMLDKLGMPTGREWKPYILRHSLAKMVRNHGATRWDLEGFMGHRAPSQAEIYAMGEFSGFFNALGTIIADLDRLAHGALHRSDTGQVAAIDQQGREKMPG